MKTTLQIIGVLILLDVLCFLWWYTSGQTPIDDFYIGGLTGAFVELL